ncbi:hypothetical protein SPI_06826 [Niveomyces insectorum RCEF 264]|uniref:Mitochondrial carrier protein n=1 Tax=Niveomyces insectorum RCEF 264 TaxID=1081102 RepID=A0A167QT57_9HYPO|nr:hypothetical protein SPI_06826 [Niveomyces insectorum RCEF 264]
MPAAVLRTAVRRVAVLRSVVGRPCAAVAGVRPLATTAAVRHKESLSTDPDYSIEKLKQESLQHQKQGKGEWMAELASDSEETVKADRSSFNLAQSVLDRQKQDKEAAAAARQAKAEKK